MIALILLKFAPKDFFSGFNFEKLMNVIGQFATAGALFFGVYSFRKTREKDRQTSLANEAKSLIAKMIKEIEKINTGKNTNISELNISVGALSHFGMDFYEIFSELDESIEKAIVRMHWQDMLYNYLIPKTKDLELGPILESKGYLSINYTIKHYRYAERFSTDDLYKKYLIFKHIAEDEEISDSIEFKLKGSIEELDQFVMYYFNKYITNDYLYGIVNKLDLKYLAPLLAAADPEAYAFENPNG